MKTLIEMIDRWRTLTGDIETPPNVVAERLRDADATVFHMLGGFTNQSISGNLRTTFSDVITKDRPVSVVPTTLGGDIRAVIDGRQCKIIPLADAGTISRFPNMLPCATVDGRTVTFYPYGFWQSGTKSVSVTYTRPPRKMVYHGGLIVRLDRAHQFGLPGRKDLMAIIVDYPTSDALPSYPANELRGGVVSVQSSEITRTDYVIEQTESGPITKMYVDPDVAVTVPQFDPNYAAQGEKQYLAVVHRCSELPEQYYDTIVQAAAGTLTTEKKADGNAAVRNK